MTSSSRNTFPIGIAISLLIGAFVIAYILIMKNTSSRGKHNNFTNIPYGYFNFDIYSVPGTKMDPYVLYGPGYLPYEANVPAVDVLRANTIPAYYKQYIKHNTSPMTARNN